MKQTSPYFLSSFFTLLSLVALAMAFSGEALTQELKESYTNLFEQPTEEVTIVEMDSLPEESSPAPILSLIKGKLGKDAYDDHLLAAENSGIDLITSERQLFLHVYDRTLVKVDGGAGYQLEKLTHSHPYLTKSSKEVLDELGRAYESIAGEGNYFTVSSVTRTMDQQKNLKKRNRNATSGNSSHSYGVSFDISYIRFNGVKNFDQKAQKNLEKVLNHFQKTGQIYVIKERKQSCYHITVR